MNLYRILKNGVLSRKEKEGIIKNISLEEPVVSLKREEVSFSSEEIVSLTEVGEVLDTEDALTIAKYKSNLRNLIRDVKEKGEVSEFRLIREDDFFPYDWKWRVNSKDTAREYAKSSLAYTLRMNEARRRLSEKKSNAGVLFPVPFQQEEEYQEALQLDSHYGQVYEPVKFRSTKHFTINTPLSFTGSYNQVSSNRNFVIVDTPYAFCESGYGYSADFQDAYTDMTHEALPISEEAIVLIEENRYPEVVQDERIKEQLKERRVVIYRGDEATAINMVLSEEGVLPYRFGKHMEYDPEIEKIMIQSMKGFCTRNHLDYSHNHGNMFGRGGHFSDLLDSENHERREFEEEFSHFMQQTLPEYEGLFTTSFFHYPERIVGAIGADKVLRGVNAYNEWAREEEIRRLQNYDEERKKVTPEIHELFVSTISIIRKYYEEKDRNPSFEYSEELHSAIVSFFHSPLVEEQVEAARKIQSYFKTSEKQMY